ncbi:MAG: hypothetical protein OER88_10505, partial [Planctomycetota bacterium]|nr:hypothetical protein [Planctomycetota bacterium]
MTSGALVLWLLVADLAGAEAALKAGKPGEAIEKLGEIEDLAKADVRTLIVLGRAHLRLGEYVAAVEPLIRASDQQPKDKALARDAALACQGSAEGAYALEYLQDARRMAARAQDDRLLAFLRYLSRDFQGALDLYQSLPVAKDPAEHVQTLTYHAECLRRLDRSDEARPVYLAAVEAALARRDLRTAYRIAFRGQVQGRLLQWLDQELAKKPDAMEYRRYRGYARVAGLRYGDAIDDLRIVVKARPRDLDAKDQLCFALLQHGARRQIDAHFVEAEALGRAVLRA